MSLFTPYDIFLFIAAGTSELPSVEEYTNYFAPNRVMVCSVHWGCGFVIIFIAKTNGDRARSTVLNARCQSVRLSSS